MDTGKALELAILVAAPELNRMLQGTLPEAEQRARYENIAKRYYEYIESTREHIL